MELSFRLSFRFSVFYTNQLDDPFDHRVRWDLSVVRALLSVRKMGADASFSDTALAHPDNRCFEHRRCIPAADLEAVSKTRMLLGASEFFATIEKTVVFDRRDRTRL